MKDVTLFVTLLVLLLLLALCAPVMVHVQIKSTVVADPRFLRLGGGRQPLNLGHKPIIWQVFAENWMKI